MLQKLSFETSISKMPISSPLPTLVPSLSGIGVSHSHPLTNPATPINFTVIWKFKLKPSMSVYKTLVVAFAPTEGLRAPRRVYFQVQVSSTNQGGNIHMQSNQGIVRSGVHFNVVCSLCIPSILLNPSYWEA